MSCLQLHSCQHEVEDELIWIRMEFLIWFLSEIGPGGCLLLNITLFKWSYYFHTLWAKLGAIFSIH